MFLPAVYFFTPARAGFFTLFRVTRIGTRNGTRIGTMSETRIHVPVILRGAKNLIK
jgi:hypothetical protein